MTLPIVPIAIWTVYLKAFMVSGKEKPPQHKTEYIGTLLEKVSSLIKSNIYKAISLVGVKTKAWV